MLTENTPCEGGDREQGMLWMGRRETPGPPQLTVTKTKENTIRQQ